MATIDVTITLNTGSLTAAEVARLVSDYLGYQPTIDEAPNPQTRAQFIKAAVANQVADWARSQRRREAREAAEAAVPDDIDAE